MKEDAEMHFIMPPINTCTKRSPGSLVSEEQAGEETALPEGTGGVTKEEVN
jgi:hypothetical protein